METFFSHLTLPSIFFDLFNYSSQTNSCIFHGPQMTAFPPPYFTTNFTNAFDILSQKLKGKKKLELMTPLNSFPLFMLP